MNTANKIKVEDAQQLGRMLELMKKQSLDMFHRLDEMRKMYPAAVLLENAQHYCRYLHYELDKIKNKNLLASGNEDV